MDKFTNDSTALFHQRAVFTARSIEKKVTNDYLAGHVSESVLVDYMMETDSAVKAGIAAGVLFKDL